MIPPDQVATIVDHAANQTDRWLFVAMLVVFLISVAILGRWLAGQYNRTLDTWREDMKAMQATMVSLHAERLSAAERYAQELRGIVGQQSTEAREMLREFSAVMTRNAETMASVQRSLTDLQASCAVARAGARPFPGPQPPDHPLRA